MAGTCKPDDSLLKGIEVTNYEIISSSVSSGSSVSGLFDGTVSASDWNTTKICYWQTTSHYVTIKFNLPCLIWRHGSQSYNNYTNKFKIYKIEDDGTETNVTSQIEQYDLTMAYKWQKCMTISETGTYKFVGTGYRINTEWFLETLDSYFAITFLDQENNEIKLQVYKENTPISLNTFPLCQENKMFAGFQRSDGTLFKNGDVITEDITLTPLFVEYEPITDSEGNIVSVKIKQDVYNLLKEAVDKYASSYTEE